MKNADLLSAKRDEVQRLIDEFLAAHGILDPGESVQVQLVVRKVVITTIIPSSEADNEPVSPEMAEKLAMKIGDLELSVRASNCLEEGKFKIQTVGELVRYSRAELLTIGRLGPTCFQEVKRKLEEYGLALKS